MCSIGAPNGSIAIIMPPHGVDGTNRNGNTSTKSPNTTHLNPLCLPEDLSLVMRGGNLNARESDTRNLTTLSRCASDRCGSSSLSSPNQRRRTYVVDGSIRISPPHLPAQKDMST